MNLNQTLGRACRHFLAREAMIGDGECCKIGHPIRKIVIAANGKSTHGIAYMFPCRPGEQSKADCPDYDPKTTEEISAERQRMSEQMDRLVKAMPVMNRVRATMVNGRIARQVIDCPFCNSPRQLHVSCAIDYNNHLSARCAECGEGFIE